MDRQVRTTIPTSRGTCHHVQPIPKNGGTASNAIEVVAANTGPVFRNARVTEPRLGKNVVAPVLLGSATLQTGSMRVPIASPDGSELDLVIDDGKVTTYRAKLKVSFKYEGPD